MGPSPHPTLKGDLGEPTFSLESCPSSLAALKIICVPCRERREGGGESERPGCRGGGLQCLGAPGPQTQRGSSEPFGYPQELSTHGTATGLGDSRTG